MNIKAVRRRKIVAVVIVASAAMMFVTALWLFVSKDGKAIVEQTTGETPESKLQAFVLAIVRNDKNSALHEWEVPTLKITSQTDALAARRSQVTDDLLTLKVSPQFLVRNIEWWTTCCEPTVTNNSRNAGGARIRVQFLDPKGLPQDYIFDIFVRDLPYWGDALSYPLRHWVIRDVYPRGQQPIYWRYIAKTTIDYLGWENTAPP